MSAPMSGWMEATRLSVEERLRSFLAVKREEALTLSPHSVELVDAVSSLTLRGGKRSRPVAMVAAYHAVAPEGTHDVTDAGAALELLQTYLLIHDDWMDRDEKRRGGPSVWASLRDVHDDEHLGASLAVLAGDLASAYAGELMTDAGFPLARVSEGLHVFWRLQREVFFGQHLDLVADDEVERMYDLKTGSYTVRGPLRLGAILGDATEAQLEALDRFAAPLGVAFQLRDELLGTFGNPGETGKPCGNDLRAGKFTVLVREARKQLAPEKRRPLDLVLGKADAAQSDVLAAVELLVASGIRAHVEDRLRALASEAFGALEGTPLQTERLRQIGELLVERSH